jgi:hypothetical protein
MPSNEHRVHRSVVRGRLKVHGMRSLRWFRACEP